MDFEARPQLFRARPSTDTLSRILACDFFEMHEARLVSGMDLPSRRTCATGTLTAGACVLESDGARIELACGDSFVIPAGTPARFDEGKAIIILTSLA